MSKDSIPNRNNQIVEATVNFCPENSNLEPQNINPQIRQPQNMQGLLRLAIETSQNAEPEPQSSLGPLDPERQTFLESALKSLTVNVVEVLITSIKRLKCVNDLSVDSDINEYIEAFENILAHIDRIDNANDFHKIGGFDIFNPCFNSVHAPIRAHACDLLAELCQNNTYCQVRALESGFMKILLELLDNDVDEHVSVKSLYAISCLTRDFSPGFIEFKKLNGLSVLMRAFSRPVDKLRTKASFLLSALCESNPVIKDDIINLGYLQLFIPLLAEDRRQSHEHILSTLENIIKNHEIAIKECRKPEYGLESILANHLKRIANDEAANEERAYCESLIILLFSNNTVSVER